MERIRRYYKEVDLHVRLSPVPTGTSSLPKSHRVVKKDPESEEAGIVAGKPDRGIALTEVTLRPTSVETFLRVG